MNATNMLLAQRHNWERLGDRFSGKHAEVNWEELLVLLACLIGSAVVIWLLYAATRWQEARLRRPNPRRLFRELCRAHRLNRWERRVLRELAESAAARQPAELFVRPDAFRPAPLPRLATERPAAFEQLRRKLFPELA